MSQRETIDGILPERARQTIIDDQLAEQHRVSTDPNWCAPAPLPDGQASPPGDGRNRRITTTKAEILRACRQLMLDGNFRPSMAEVCELARRSMRSGFEHFHDIESLRLAVLDMPGVAEHIGILTVSRSPAGIARLVVLGRT